MSDKLRLEKTLGDLQAKAAKIESEIDRLKAKRDELQRVVNAEMLEDGESNSLESLVQVKAKIEALEGSREYAAGELKLARQALDDFKMVEKARRAGEIENRCFALIAEIQDLLGAAGLNGKLAELEALRADLLAVGYVTQDAQIRANWYLGLVDGLRSVLKPAWDSIENQPWLSKKPGRKF